MRQLMVFLTLIGCLAFGACSQGDGAAKKAETKPAAATPKKSQADIDRELIAGFVKDNNMTAVATPSGLHYVIEKQGTGGLQPTDEVEVHYEGTLLNGEKFDSSYDRGQTASFPLNRVIRGWTEGIPLIGVGGKGKLIIPSGLAYGPRKRPKIPENSVLVFNVEVIAKKDKAVATPKKPAKK